MNRQQRRERKRKAAKYDKRTHFTKAEVEDLNRVSYDLGVEHTLESAHAHCGIGPIRRQRIVDGLKPLQQRDFEVYDYGK